MYAGGHASAGTASVGRKSPGFTGHTLGYDCSGAVAAALSGAGLWPAGAPVPADNGIVAQLMREGIVAPGPGAVTLYDKPGVHIFMNIGGRYFGTSDGGAGNPSQSHHGAGWLSDGAPDARNPAFKRYHILPARLRAGTLYGSGLTFRAAAGLDLSGFADGDHVRVAYRPAGTGPPTARAVTYTNAKTAVGTLTSITDDQSAFAIQAAGGSVTFSDQSGLVDESQLGDRLAVTYTSRPAGLAAHAVTDLAPATVLAATGTITQIAPDEARSAFGRTLAKPSPSTPTRTPWTASRWATTSTSPTPRTSPACWPPTTSSTAKSAHRSRSSSGCPRGRGRRSRGSRSSGRSAA